MRVSSSPVISGSLLVLLLLGASYEASASTEGPLSLGVTGSTPSDPTRNPVAILWPADVQRLMLKIARRPYSRQEIESAMGSHPFSIDDARAVGLLREEDGLFHIDFNLLTMADQQRILEVSSDLGRKLATAFLEQQAEFEALAAGHRQSPALQSELLYIVLGCFSLDWDGLSLTEELGYRSGAQRTIDGQAFTPWAKEKGAGISLRGLYWGSHNETVGAITVTTFGDHAAVPRFGMPDLLWRSTTAVSAFEDMPAAKLAVNRMFSVYAADAMPDIAKTMMQLGRGSTSAKALSDRTGIRGDKLDSMLAFLEEAQYIIRRGEIYESKVLVLRAEDAELVHRLVAMGRLIMTRWHEENYDRIVAALTDLTPIRNGVPFERVYTEIWHFIFGIANRHLVEAGLFADPYSPDRRHQGFLPVIWASELAQD